MLVFFFNDTATTEIYTLSLHDALPISRRPPRAGRRPGSRFRARVRLPDAARAGQSRSEEHTSELQSQSNLVCRLLLEKKKTELEARHRRDRVDLAREHPLAVVDTVEER